VEKRTYTVKVTAYPGTKAHDKIEVQVEVEVEIEIEVKVGRSSAGSTFFLRAYILPITPKIR
jgi:hypothetical protein